MTNLRCAYKAARGFTLLEMLIYMGLCAVILTGVIASSYPLFTGTERSIVRTNSDIEVAFLNQKILWALSTGSGVTSPSAGSSGTSLTVNHPSGIIVFAPSGTGVMMSVNGGAARELVSSRMPITNLSFTHQAGVGKFPAAIIFSFDAGGRHVGPIVRYAR